MSFPPQSKGGGFGPPPPPTGGDSFGRPPHQRGAGPSGYPPPPAQSGDAGKRTGDRTVTRNAAVAVGVGVGVLVAATLVGLALGVGGGKSGGGSRTAVSGGRPPSGSSQTGTGSGVGAPSPSPSAQDGTDGADGADGADIVRYVVLRPGQCFDHPELSGVAQVTIRACDTAHDGEVIADETLTGGFTSPAELRGTVLRLCEADARRRMESVPADGRTYYYYAIYPSLRTYTGQGKHTISCALTLSNRRGGGKLTKPLP